MKKGSVEIPEHTSLKEDNAESVFDRYRKGGCHSGGGEAPKNVSKKGCFLQSRKKYTMKVHRSLIFKNI
jgi:hypothetical protein